MLRAVLRVSTPLSGREIARRAGVVYNPAYRALQSLVASGVLARQDHGRVKTYTLRDPDLPLVAGLRELFEREERRTQSAISDLAHMLCGVVSIVLFGSEARGETRPGSDTDVLIIVDRTAPETHERVRDACLELAERHGLALSWHVVDLDQVREWEATQDQFWQNVVRDGVWLHGETLEGIRLRWRLGRITLGKPVASGR